MKKNKLSLLIIFLCVSQLFLAQKKNSGVKYKRNKDKSVTFSYYSTMPSSVFIILKFKRLTNAFGDQVKKTVKGYSDVITTLNQINDDSGIGFSYSYKTFYGNLDKKPNHDFKYILPFKKNKTIKVRNLNYLGKKFGDKEPENWKSFQFLTSPNDTVFAIRKGIVVKVIDEFKSDNSKTYGYKNKSNAIIIEHEDGTLARYSVLKHKSLMVKVGDIVYPTAPIAIAGSYDKPENSQLRLSIYYLNERVKEYDFYAKKPTISNQIHIYSYVNPLFYVDSNKIIKLEKNEVYTSFYDDSTIEVEMSKREGKKWKKKGLLVKRK